MALLASSFLENETNLGMTGLLLTSTATHRDSSNCVSSRGEIEFAALVRFTNWKGVGLVVTCHKTVPHQCAGGGGCRGIPFYPH